MVLSETYCLSWMSKKNVKILKWKLSYIQDRSLPAVKANIDKQTVKNEVTEGLKVEL